MRILYEFTAEEFRQMVPYGLVSYGMSERNLNTFTKKRKFAEAFTKDEQEECKHLGRLASGWVNRGMKEPIVLDGRELNMWMRLSEFCVKEFGMKED